MKREPEGRSNQGFEAATNRKLHVAFSDIAIIREDIRTLKQRLNEHGYRLAKIESVLGDEPG